LSRWNIATIIVTLTGKRPTEALSLFAAALQAPPKPVGDVEAYYGVAALRVSSAKNLGCSRSK
jgi:hypothetical protein